MRGPRSAAVPWPSRLGTLRQVFSFRRGDRFYNWSGRRADLRLLLDDTVATLHKRKPKGAKSCTRQVNAAGASAKPGAKTLALPAKGLPKGKYTATLTATDAAGNKSTTVVRFTV